MKILCFCKHLIRIYIYSCTVTECISTRSPHPSPCGRHPQALASRRCRGESLSTATRRGGAAVVCVSVNDPAAYCPQQQGEKSAEDVVDPLDGALGSMAAKWTRPVPQNAVERAHPNCNCATEQKNCPALLSVALLALLGPRPWRNALDRSPAINGALLDPSRGDRGYLRLLHNRSVANRHANRPSKMQRPAPA